MDAKTFKHLWVELGMKFGIFLVLCGGDHMLSTRFPVLNWDNLEAISYKGCKEKGQG